jgi:hypothetical protein
MRRRVVLEWLAAGVLIYAPVAPSPPLVDHLDGGAGWKAIQIQSRRFSPAAARLDVQLES